MQSDHNNIEKLDNFSREVGEKLRNHHIPVDRDVWESLVDKLPSRKRTIPAYWLWAATATAALLLGLLLFLHSPADEQPVEMVQEGAKNREIEQPAAAPEEPIASSIKEPLKSPLFAQQTQPRHQTGERVTVSESALLELDVKNEQEADLADVFSEAINNTTVLVNPEEQGTTGSPADELLVVANPPLFVKEESASRSLIAALGSGGAPLDFSLGSQDMYSPIYGGPVPGGDYNNGGGWDSGDNRVLSPRDYTDIVHRPPVSLSLTADFPIGKKLSLETGLSYTYLYSRFSRNDHLVYRGTLKQHYIGLPVNMRYEVWQDGPRQIYLLAGGTIEKGLRAVYKQEKMHNNGVVHRLEIHKRIAGVQFSAQGGAGFSYRLNNSLNLFGEPRLTYYFRNNQPLSARTENPLTFGLNAGIRIQFE